jgi:hypothetical protein
MFFENSCKNKRLEDNSLYQKSASGKYTPLVRKVILHFSLKGYSHKEIFLNYPIKAWIRSKLKYANPLLI